MPARTRNLHRRERIAPRFGDWQLGGDAEALTVNVYRRGTWQQHTARSFHSRAVFASVLGISVLAHVALLWLYFPRHASSPSPPRQGMEATATFIELNPDLNTSLSPAEPTALLVLQEFHTTAVERAATLEDTLTEALHHRAETAASHQQQVATLETEQAALSGQLEMLTVEKADLATQLSNERQRAAELEEHLEAARREKEHEVAGVKGAYDQLVAALQGEISQKDIALRQAQQRLVVSILDRVLFPSGQAALTPEGRRLLAKVARILASATDRRILIEGHTDDVPISPALAARFPTNWELSTARATEVVKYLLTQTKLPANRFSAVGRADTAPVTGNIAEAGRAQNRRIEIILLPLEEQSKDLS